MYVCPDPRAVPEYLLRSGESLNDSEGLCIVFMYVFVCVCVCVCVCVLVCVCLSCHVMYMNVLVNVPGSESGS